MEDVDYFKLNQYAKKFVNLTDEKIELLHSIRPEIMPHIQTVTDNFYIHLSNIEEANVFISDKIDILKPTHYNWIKNIFESDFSIEYTKLMYRVGDVHVKIDLPVEFMSGAMSIITEELIVVFHQIYGSDMVKIKQAQQAITAALGFSLFIMQESYQLSSLDKELDKFLQITGMSRILFNKLASIYS